MGASISSIIAQLVMEDLECDVISKLDFSLPFFYRYVDDCITAIPKNKTEYVLDQFNKYHVKLKFTVESEINKKINFLDMTIHHRDGNLQTEWYTKPTWSGRYLNYNSQHHISQKKSVIIGLADRAIRLSDSEFVHDAINKAKEILHLNSYPRKLVNAIFEQRKKKHSTRNQDNFDTTIPEDKKENQHLCIPYIPYLSENLDKLFKKYDIEVCHKGYNLLRNNFSRLKSNIPMDKRTHTIYQIPCADCIQEYTLDKLANT
ncbi:hypothetical protein WA026_017424 [Henosepilachna vigintioctopunctata]|uniref:Reverse transcriptase domain-containing protein n=1 Tax=Henosepilachna vigintioctopunctata TaxID=420089 RepID=A0AAW1V8B4_9CUCU